MKNLFTLLLLIGFSFSYTQTQYCNGFEKGYQKGLESCLQIGVTPVCPIPEIGADSYNDGYGMGYAQARQKCSSSKQTTTSAGTSGKADPTLVSGAKNAYSGSNSHIEIPDEAANAIGQGVTALMTAGKIKNAKRDLRQLPLIYKELPNLKTAFDIYIALSDLLMYDYKVKTDEEIKEAREKVYSIYGDLTELLGEETRKVMEFYDYSWSTYKKENKEKAKEEEIRLKDYLKSKKKKSKKKK